MLLKNMLISSDQKTKLANVSVGSPASDDGTNSIRISYPSDIEPGDYLIVTGAVDPGNITGVASQPTGWTTLAEANSNFVFGKIATGSEGGSLTINFGEIDNEEMVGIMYALRTNKPGSWSLIDYHFNQTNNFSYALPVSNELMFTILQGFSRVSGRNVTSHSPNITEDASITFFRSANWYQGTNLSGETVTAVSSDILKYTALTLEFS